MRKEYAARYRSLYERHWWWRAREAVLLREVAAWAPAGGWGRILDIGCGDALMFEQLERFGEVWGVEADATLVSNDNPYRPRIHIGPFDASYQPGFQFGLVTMLDVLEHVAAPVEALRRAAALLRPGGLILVTVPAFPLLWTAHDDVNEHIIRYTRGTFDRVAEYAGLRVLRSRYLFHWVFAAKLAARSMEAIRGGAPGPVTVPPGWLNQVLLGMTQVEERLLGPLELPFGSSFLAWCAWGHGATSAVDSPQEGGR